MMVVMMAMVMTAMTVVVTGVAVVTVWRGLAQWAAPGGTGLRGDAGSAGSVKVRKSMVGALLLPPRR